MDEIDLNKRSEVEKLPHQEFLLHLNQVRDTVTQCLSPSSKPIDRIALTSHMTSYIDAANNMRMVASFVREYARVVPENVLKSMLKSARKSFDSVRRDWLQIVTKLKEG